MHRFASICLAYQMSNQAWMLIPNMVCCAQVGALSGGLAGTEWSPDGNLLCLVSATGQLLLMNKVRLWVFFPGSALSATHPNVHLLQT